MIRDEDIFFYNEPFMAVVEIFGNKALKCFPVIIREEFIKQGFCVSIGLLLEDGRAQVMNSSEFLGSIFNAFRATGFLRRYGVIEKGDLAKAFFAGARETGGNVPFYHSGAKSRVIEQIGQDVFNGIMSLDIPKEIIQKVVQQTRQGGRELDYLHAEVAAGTIPAHDVK